MAHIERDDLGEIVRVDRQEALNRAIAPYGLGDGRAVTTSQEALNGLLESRATSPFSSDERYESDGRGQFAIVCVGELALYGVRGGNTAHQTGDMMAWLHSGQPETKWSKALPISGKLMHLEDEARLYVPSGTVLATALSIDDMPMGRIALGFETGGVPTILPTAIYNIGQLHYVTNLDVPLIEQGLES